jgi:hypothetical protein
VDDDDPGGERDRSAANRLYESLGFKEIDRLHCYELEMSSKMQLRSHVRIPTQAGRGFRFDPGQGSDLMPATIPR